ncbi:MAG: DNA repair protein RecN [Candidatus Latescibacteria bacterium]|nr:DNA repair protein RecN [Candidatus Latescibacterota bacterium]
MLESITIHNYAIIDEMTVEIPGGLTVITGETGAGKSIVVDAMELVLGARASSEMIRSGADRLDVTGVFTLDEGTVIDQLPEDVTENVLILRRELRVDGSGRCYINDRPVTLKALKKVGDCLVDLHGQHDHQSLFEISEHVMFLDGFGGLMPLTQEVQQLFNEFIQIRNTIGKIRNHIENAQRNKELHDFQIKEIDQAKIVPGEDTEVGQDIQRLSRAVELKEFGWRAFETLSESDGSVEDLLGNLMSGIEGLERSDPALTPFVQRLEELATGVSELAGDLRRYADEIEDDPGLLAELEDRLALIERLKKKYGPLLEDVFAYREKIGAETQSHQDFVVKLEKLEIRLEEIKTKLYYRALKLSEKRKKLGPMLSGEVESHLAELGLSGAKLVIEFTECESGEELVVNNKVVVNSAGIDRVEFMFSANPGEPPRPLVKIASGGELSRVMLALKLALSKVDSVPTMVFDEIDVGVSGRVAEAVGKKLLKLSENRQVIVVTHLPQIAGKAGQHFSARKSVENGRTRANLVKLDETMRQKELASMLSGENLTEAALEHAKELMQKSENDNSVS